jgi:hypothetical protein
MLQNHYNCAAAIGYSRAMAKKRVLKTERGVTLSESILFDGEPRVKVGVRYTVATRKKPAGKDFDDLGAAKKYFAVQVSLGPKE